MKRNVSTDYRKYFLSEFELFDGDHFITFNIVDIDTARNQITVAISNEGRISQDTFDLMTNDNGLYFEYGLYQEKIAVDDFNAIEED